MTTIAYRDGVLAADTGATIGSSRVGTAAKIVRRPDGALAAAAGTAAFAHSFLRWVETGCSGPSPEAKRYADCLDRGAIFRLDGVIELFEDCGRFEITAPYYAFGSGRPEALGAMFAGADARTAVLAAMTHDDATFGDVVVLEMARPARLQAAE